MSQLIEQRSRKAARILDSARELVLDHGVRKVTVSEIARTAGVGKGTVYLYWAAKEDLILGLFARCRPSWTRSSPASPPTPPRYCHAAWPRC